MEQLDVMALISLGQNLERMKDAKKSGGVKTALELALERMQRQQCDLVPLTHDQKLAIAEIEAETKAKGGDVVPLTHDQKAAIAEIEAETKAKVAEQEIMAQERVRAAYAGGDAEAARKVEEEIQTEIARIRERGERKKEQIRRGE